MKPEYPIPTDNSNQFSTDVNPSPPLMPQNSGQVVSPITNPMPPVANAFNPQSATPDHDPEVNSLNIADIARPKNSFSQTRLIFVLLLILIVSIASIVGGLSLINKSQKPFQAASASGSSTPTGWTSFSNQDGNFSAMFPNTPEAIPQTAQSLQQGTIVFNGYQSGNENTAYVVIYGKFSRDYVLPSDTQALLVNYVNGLENSLQNVQVISDNNATIGGFNAETYEFIGTKDSKNLDLTGEVVLDNRVLYNVFTTQIKNQAPNTRYFLNNFMIGK